MRWLRLSTFMYLAAFGCNGSGRTVQHTDAAPHDLGEGCLDLASAIDHVSPGDGIEARFDSLPPRDSHRRLDGVAGWDAGASLDVADSCRIEIAASSGGSLVDLTADPTAFLRVKGTIVWGDTEPFEPEWSWSVIRSDGRNIEAAQIDDPSEAQFPIAIPARYDIAATILGNGQSCVGFSHAIAQAPASSYRLYHLRVIPPTNDPDRTIVPYEVDVRVNAGSPPITKDVTMEAGILVTVDPSTSLSGSPSGGDASLTVAVPSYIRIQSSGSTWTSYGRSSDAGPFQAVLDSLLEFQVLVVPDPENPGNHPLPPFLLSRATSGGSTVDARYISASANPLQLPSGIHVVGHLTTPDGPAQGATLTLRSYVAPDSSGQNDLLFSTVGRADEDGAYELWVNQGGVF